MESNVASKQRVLLKFVHITFREICKLKPPGARSLSHAPLTDHFKHWLQACHQQNPALLYVTLTTVNQTCSATVIRLLGSTSRPSSLSRTRRHTPTAYELRSCTAADTSNTLQHLSIDSHIETVSNKLQEFIRLRYNIYLLICGHVGSHH